VTVGSGGGMGLDVVGGRVVVGDGTVVPLTGATLAGMRG